MSGVRITVQAEDTRAAGAFARLAELGANLHPLMDTIGAALLDSTLQRFEDGAGPDGAAWKPSRRAQAQGGQTLVDSNRLRDSLVYQAGPAGVTVGTNVIYAGVHQTGATIRPVNAERLVFTGPDGALVFAREVTIPARPYLGLSGEDEDEIGHLASAHLNRALTAAAAGGGDAR